MRDSRVDVTRGAGGRVWMLLVFVGLLAFAAVAGPEYAGAAACPNTAVLTGASVGLPDCRAYEQVSPLDKNGVSAYPTQALPAQVESSLTGTGVSYLGYEAFPGAEGNSGLFSAHVSTRSSGGWQTQEITPGVPEAHVLRIYLVSYAFSEDLSQAVLKVPLVPLTSDAAPGLFNLFLRHPNGGYSLVNSSPPALSAEQLCPPFLASLCFLFSDLEAFAGASSDYSHILFESTAQLTAEAPETSIESLYEQSGGTDHLVGFLPDGSVAGTSTAGAGSSAEYGSTEQEKDLRVEHAISRDGSRVVFQAPADGGIPDSAQAGLPEVYERIDGKETVEISAPAPGAPAASNAEPATFAGASDDGLRVFFTSSAELTKQSKTGSENNSEDLYEYNVGKESLRDLSVDTNPADATTGAMVQGVIDESTDGAYVYFVANGQLVPGKGVDGQPNLYMVHNGGRPVFITTLNSGSCQFSTSVSSDACVWSPYPVVREAYVTPDGRHLAFMSTKRLATTNFPGGYDNTDQTTGEADSEVYEYTAPTAAEEENEEAGQLVCGSCDPGGVQPVGSSLMGGISLAQLHGEEGRPTYAGISTPFYRARALNDAGTRLFYTTPLAHIGPAELSSPFERVYEYEANGEGSCAAVGGCQLLISSPESGESDQFIGASADGTDVYIATSSRLSPMDTDNLRDVYDARVDGGFATPPAETPCESACRAHGQPASSAPLVGIAAGPSGNLAAPVAQTHGKKKCSKGHKLSHGKCVKPKKKPKKPRKAKKASENRRTR